MTTTTTSRRDESGFTLVEVLLVLLLLGILAGIAIFGGDVFKDRASEACSNSNQRMEQTVGAIFDVDTVEGLYELEPGDCSALGDPDAPHGQDASVSPERSRPPLTVSTAGGAAL